MQSINNSYQVNVQRSLRYVVRPATREPGHLVYLLHGYGQLARYFIQKVEAILPDNVCFIAPEGMHRFYLNGNSGRVGASWMTKEARELDILENTAALDQLHDSILQQFTPKKITVIGFSQGGATAARWITNGRIQPDCFVSWASVFPPDLSIPETAKSMRQFFVLGIDDIYFPGESAEAACEAHRLLHFDIVRFTGGHDLDPAIIQSLINQL